MGTGVTLSTKPPENLKRTVRSPRMNQKIKSERLSPFLKRALKIE
jgi:hypothetical protein